MGRCGGAPHPTPLQPAPFPPPAVGVQTAWARITFFDLSPPVYDTAHRGGRAFQCRTHTPLQVAPRKTPVMGPEDTWACGPAAGTLSIPRGNLLPDEKHPGQEPGFQTHEGTGARSCDLERKQEKDAETWFEISENAKMMDGKGGQVEQRGARALAGMNVEVPVPGAQAHSRTCRKCPFRSPQLSRAILVLSRPCPPSPC